MVFEFVGCLLPPPPQCGPYGACQDVVVAPESSHLFNGFVVVAPWPRAVHSLSDRTHVPPGQRRPATASAWLPSVLQLMLGTTWPAPWVGTSRTMPSLLPLLLALTTFAAVPASHASHVTSTSNASEPSPPCTKRCRAHEFDTRYLQRHLVASVLAQAARNSKAAAEDGGSRGSVGEPLTAAEADVPVSGHWAASAYVSKYGPRWLVPRTARQRGRAVMGDTRRLRAAMGRFLAGGDLNVIFLGGSITAGHGRVRKTRTQTTAEDPAYPDHVRDILWAAVGPEAARRVRVYNHGIGATTTSYMSTCFRRWVRNVRRTGGGAGGVVRCCAGVGRRGVGGAYP